MLKISYADCFGLSLAISSQFTLRMCDADENRKKSPKLCILGTKSRSKSLTLIPSASSSTMLVMISSTSVPICNRFYARRANGGKMTTFRAVPFFDAVMNPLTQRHEILSQRTSPCGSHSENFVILACTVFIG